MRPSKSCAAMGSAPSRGWKKIGYLNKNLLAVHLSDANDDEVRQVARSGAAMIACPGSIGIIDGIVLLLLSISRRAELSLWDLTRPPAITATICLMR